MTRLNDRPKSPLAGLTKEDRRKILRIFNESWGNISEASDTDDCKKILHRCQTATERAEVINQVHQEFVSQQSR